MLVVQAYIQPPTFKSISFVQMFFLKVVSLRVIAALDHKTAFQTLMGVCLAQLLIYISFKKIREIAA